MSLQTFSSLISFPVCQKHSSFVTTLFFFTQCVLEPKISVGDAWGYQESGQVPVSSSSLVHHDMVVYLRVFCKPPSRLGTFQTEQHLKFDLATTCHCCCDRCAASASLPAGAHLCVAARRTEMHTFSRDDHFGNCNFYLYLGSLYFRASFWLRKLKV